MRNYTEFKGYRSRIEFDKDSDSFVPRRVAGDEPGSPEKLFVVMNSTPEDNRQSTGDPVPQRRRVQA